jgi:hypothetical protein
MQFHADSPLTFRCEPYAIYNGIQGWSAYNMSRRQAIIVKNGTLSECLKACEQDAIQTKKG